MKYITSPPIITDDLYYSIWEIKSQLHITQSCST